MNESDFEQYWYEAHNILIELAGEISQAERENVKEKIDKTKVIQFVGDNVNSKAALYQ